VTPADLDLDPAELRELHPAELILECVGIRHAPPYDPAALDELRAATERLRAAADPLAAARADEDFHRGLAARCADPRVVEAIVPLQLKLRPYKRAYLSEPDHIERSAAQHEAIVGALAAGDHPAAEQRLRRYRAASLSELMAQLEAA
jgi:DNA-binding GntR family transcriptional regulator